MTALGSWLRRNVKVLGIWGSVTVALVGLVLVFVGGRAEALGIGLMTCAAVTVAAFAATEAKHLGDATPDHAEPHPGPDPDLSRAPASPGPVALDVTGRLMGG